MIFAKDKALANAWLRKAGVPHSIAQLYDDPRLCPGSGGKLLELLKQPFCLDIRVVIAEALFRRRLSPSQKAEAVEFLLTLVRENAGRGDEDDGRLSFIVMNCVANNVDPGKVHEIGQMALDPRLGELRNSFTFVLYRIGSAEAISYLRRAARDNASAATALEGLARLRVEGTLALCEEALAKPSTLYKEAIKETYEKLKRTLANESRPLPHLTKEPTPKHLESWSANVDGSNLGDVLHKVGACCDAGLEERLISEVQGAAESLSPDQAVRLKIPAIFGGREVTLWLEIFCDDNNAYDLYVSSAPPLIAYINRKRIVR